MLLCLGTKDGGAPGKMEIAFRSKALRAVCLSGEDMDEQYGAEGAAALRGRLADMRAAECLGDVPLVTLLPSAAGTTDASIEVGGGLRLVVKANHKRPPTLRDGNIDWPGVHRILIQRVESSDA